MWSIKILFISKYVINLRKAVYSKAKRKGRLSVNSKPWLSNDTHRCVSIISTALSICTLTLDQKMLYELPIENIVC